MNKLLKNCCILSVISLFPLLLFAKTNPKRMYYEIRTYTITKRTQETRIDRYLKDAFIPAAHRAGIQKIGVFKPIEQDTARFGKKVILFLPYKNLNQITKLSVALKKDAAYQKQAQEFLDAPVNNPVFERYTTTILKAFPLFPEYNIPSFETPMHERIYDMRMYESLTEAKADKKIHMFNEGGEMNIFKEIGANPVFAGKIIAGTNMPGLIYMTSYANKKSLDQCWQKFMQHPHWLRLREMEEYKNAMSKFHVYQVYPAAYSEF